MNMLKTFTALLATFSLVVPAAAIAQEESIGAIDVRIAQIEPGKGTEFVALQQQLAGALAADGHSPRDALIEVRGVLGDPPE